MNEQDCKKRLKELKCCVIIPTYNNDKFLESVIQGVMNFSDDVFVVNDGSTDQTVQILSNYKHLNIISYPVNKGKGYALRKAFEEALKKRFEYAIAIDSDSQHDPKDIPIFVESLSKHPEAFIIGVREMPVDHVSRSSSFANKFSNFWFRFITGVDLQDTQSGYRLYPIKRLSGIKYFTNKYEFELEILVRAAWRNIEIIQVPVSVYYPPQKERVTHFRPFKDFGRISVLNTVFVFIALLYIKPFAFLKHLKKENIKEFLKTNLVNTQDSDMKLVWSVMFGLFMGIIPIWGYQLIAAIALAHFLKLNKLIVIVTANISIPPMIPIILYFSYLTGGLILYNHFDSHINISFEYVKHNLVQYIIGSLVLAICVSICMGFITFLFLKIFRKKRITN